MCGILGYAGLHVPDTQFARAHAELDHRGPDASGSWQTDLVGLGHQRLAIIDLSVDARQPLWNEDEQVAVVANGEIYNFRELRTQLVAHGHVFRSDSDSEVLVHGYEQWGEDGLLERLNGMFAFALYDRRRGRLLLARDRMGIKPIYFANIAGGVYFASEIGALRLLLPATPAIDARARANYFAFGYVPGHLCIYEGCRKLLPGEMAVYSHEDRTLQTRRYWTPPLPETGRLTASRTEEIAAIIDDAVRVRLVGDRPLGCFLSGGIDSSLIAALASRHVSGLRTFSIGFDYGRYDESPFAERVAAHLGTDHTALYCTDSDALALVSQLPRWYGEPFSDSSAIPTYLLSKLAREHVVVALSGDGGDELAIGYDNYLDAGRVQNLMRVPYRLLAGRLGQRFLKQDSRAGKFARALQVESLADACLLSSGLFHRLFHDRLTGDHFPVTSSYWGALFEQAEDCSLASAWAWVDMQHWLPEDILAKVDRASMQHALEVRVPLLDHRVVTALLGCKQQDKLSGKTGKLVLREILAEYVPRPLWERPKQGFSPPLLEWLRGPLWEMTNDYLAPDRLRREGLLDSTFVQQLLRELKDGTRDTRYYVWALLIWELWREHAGV